MNKISRLSKLNIDSILDLQSKSFSDDLWDDKDQLLKYLEWPIAHGMFENEILKGLIFGYHHSHGIFHIYSIEVFPEYQKQKIGQELLQNVIDYCRWCNRNCPKCGIDVESIPLNYESSDISSNDENIRT